MDQDYEELTSISTMEAGTTGTTAYGSTENIQLRSHTTNSTAMMDDPTATLSVRLLQELHEAVKMGSISKLRALLPDDQTLREVNHIFSADDIRGSLLHVAAKAGDERSEVAEILLEHGANPNARDLSGSKYCPIHYAAERLQPQIMKVLLKGEANPNVREGDHGRTPLHLILRNWQRKEKEFKECLEILLEQHEKVNVDSQDDKLATPLFLAIDRKCDYMVQKIIEHGANPQNERIKSTFTNLKFPLPLNKEVKVKKIRHFGDELLDEGLKPNDLRRFKEILSDIDQSGENKSTIIDEDYGKTLLQYACDRGHTEFVEELLKNNADPLKEDMTTLYSPLLYASRKGYNKIIEHLTNSMKVSDNLEKGLTKKDKKGETALHKIVKQEYKTKEEGRNYEASFIILMKYQNYINVDEQDDFGCTALHYAVLWEDQKFVRHLLFSGAHWGIANIAGNIAIKNIKSELVEEILNDCIDLKNQDPDFQKFEITLNYCMFVPSNLNNNTETERLMYLSNLQSHQSLLCHPIIDIFLFLKWQRIAPLYYINILTYSIYLVTLTAYSLNFHGTFQECDSSMANSTVIDFSERNSTDSYNISIDYENENSSNFPLKIFLLTIICLYTVFIAIREIVQCCVSWKLYFKRIENWLEMAIVILSVALPLSINCKVQQSLIAWLILITWTEFIFLLGYHPNLANYVNMFTKVSFNFLKFITMFSFMFIAFSLSFYLVFQINDEFKTYHQSLLRTFAMSTGELEYPDLPLSSFPVSSHLLYTIFIFLIILVLMNLLNGLAVSDISLLQKEAEIVSYKSRVELLSYLESIFLASFTSNNTTGVCGSSLYKNPLMKLGSLIIPKGLMLHDCLDEQRVRLFPNKCKSEKWKICGKNCENHPKSNLNASHIDSALAVLQAVHNNTDASFTQLTERIASMDESLNILQQQNNTMDAAMNILQHQNNNMDTAIKHLTEIVEKNTLIPSPSKVTEKSLPDIE
ncbi:unnamed protein product [Meganyctiphanes norvegica]|uniref:Ion transport domain-containing protein n=1 Tax=Meganyctiphanes norvegica TaxID=48144 RepID=A0AAV2SHW8_MEGNR